jgi:hypothetical protein
VWGTGFGGNSAGQKHLENVNVGGTIILKGILKKKDERD